MPLKMALLFTWNDVVLAWWNDINTTPCTWSQTVLYWSLHVLAEQNQANDASFWYPFQWQNHIRENPSHDWPDYLYADGKVSHVYLTLLLTCKIFAIAG